MKRIFGFILSLCFIIGLCSCSFDSATVSDKQTASTLTEEKKEFKIGDEVFITNDSGEYKFTITGVEETSERNEFADETPDRVIIISYNYENISYSSDLFISEMNFKAYDKDNNSMDTYPASVQYADSVSAGRKTSGQMAYGLNSQENYVELEFYDNMFMDSDCKIILEW